MTARVRVRRAGDNVYVGTLTLGCPDCGGVGDTDGDGVITIGAFGDTQADALHKASLIAERIASDPVMQAILPPGTMAAIVATKKLAGAAKRGSRALRGLWRRLRGKGKKRLAKALHKEAALREGHALGDVEGLWSGLKKAARGVKRGVKAYAKYGTGAGLTYMAARALARKLRRKPARRRRVAPPPPVAPMESQEPMTDEDVMNPPPPPEPAPMPEAPQYAEMPAEEYADEYADEYDDGGDGAE